MICCNVYTLSQIKKRKNQAGSVMPQWSDERRDREKDNLLKLILSLKKEA